MALAMVPSPGRSRSGIQSSSTTALTRKVATPIDTGRIVDRPCASTVQGLTPSPPWTISASPVPKAYRPMSRTIPLAGVGDQREGERQRVTGTVRAGRSHPRISTRRTIGVRTW